MTYMISFLPDVPAVKMIVSAFMQLSASDCLLANRFGFPVTACFQTQKKESVRTPAAFAYGFRLLSKALLKLFHLCFVQSDSLGHLLMIRTPRTDIIDRLLAVPADSVELLEPAGIRLAERGNVLDNLKTEIVICHVGTFLPDKPDDLIYTALHSPSPVLKMND